MLPRPERLLASRDFQRVYRHGRSYAHPLMILYVLPLQEPAQPDSAAPRAGFVASKKVGKAHDRNLAKRRVREAYRLLARRSGPPVLMVWVVRPAAVRATYAQIAAGMTNLLQTSGWLKPSPDVERPVALTL
ncbi:MAG: ribonuclease P protein component [Candidatus Sericytochromatia bacterium]|nr:ribonuclease P protein component [Candidatus Sericytochromatia bacterium]